MAATATAPQRATATQTAPPAPKKVLCKYQEKKGQFCNGTAPRDYAYCWKHAEGLGNKIASFAKAYLR
jgi:hypothetical protein